MSLCTELCAGPRAAAQAATRPGPLWSVSARPAAAPPAAAPHWSAPHGSAAPTCRSTCAEIGDPRSRAGGRIMDHAQPAATPAARSIALRVFGQRGLSGVSRGLLGGLPPTELCRAVFTPDVADVMMPRRSRPLWEPSDNSAAFVRELIWAYSAELARGIGHHPRPDAGLQSV